MKYNICYLAIALLSFSPAARAQWQLSALLSPGASQLQNHGGLLEQFPTTFSYHGGLEAHYLTPVGITATVGLRGYHERVRVRLQIYTPPTDLSYSHSLGFVGMPVELGYSWQQGRYEVRAGLQPEVLLNPDPWFMEGKHFNLSLLLGGRVRLFQTVYVGAGYQHGMTNLLADFLVPDSPEAARYEEYWLATARFTGTVWIPLWSGK